MTRPVRNRCLPSAVHVRTKNLPKEHDSMWKPSQCLAPKRRQDGNVTSDAFQERQFTVALASQVIIGLKKLQELCRLHGFGPKRESAILFVDVKSGFGMSRRKRHFQEPVEPIALQFPIDDQD